MYGGVHMVSLLTKSEQQTILGQVIGKINSGDLRHAEMNIQLVMEHALKSEQLDCYAQSLLLQIRLLNYTHHYSDAFLYLERLKPYVTTHLTEEEQYIFHIQQTIFNFAHGIGHPVDDFMQLLHELETKKFAYLQKIIINQLLSINFQEGHLASSIELYERYETIFYEDHLSKILSDSTLQFQFNAFRLFYAQRDFEKCADLFDHFKTAPESKQTPMHDPLYWSCKALLEIATGNVQEAMTYFNHFLERLETPYFYISDMELWITALENKQLTKEVIFYQKKVIQIMKKQAHFEELTKRSQIIEEKSRKYYEERLYKDHLTGVKNRNYLDHFMQKDDHHHPFTLCILDIDCFKTINDTYGHTVGDHAIRFVAKLMKNWIPDQNVEIMRYGGDEFIVTLPFSYEEALPLIQQLHDIILNTPFQLREGRGAIFLSASIGIGYSERPQSLEMLFQLADAALYEAKNKRGIVSSKHALS